MPLQLSRSNFRNYSRRALQAANPRNSRVIRAIRFRVVAIWSILNDRAKVTGTGRHRRPCGTPHAAVSWTIFPAVPCDCWNRRLALRSTESGTSCYRVQRSDYKYPI